MEKSLDSEYNRMQWVGEEYLLNALIDTCKDKLIEKHQSFSKDVLYLMGYLYRYWYYYKNENIKKIYKQALFETMNINYLMFHTMDNELAIDDLKEIFKQKKNVYKENKKQIN